MIEWNININNGLSEIDISNPVNMEYNGGLNVSWITNSEEKKWGSLSTMLFPEEI